MAATLEIHGAVGVIRMDDGKANAVNPDMVAALNKVLDEAEANTEVKSVVITGRADKFSAGFDLKYFQSNPPEKGAELVASGGVLAHRIFSFSKPVVAAINGHAIAMGCFLVQACDRRIGVEGNYFTGANETAINMVLPQFAVEFLKYRLNPSFHDEAVLEATLYPLTDAIKVGFIDAVTSADVLLDEAKALAAKLGELPANAYKGNKLLMREAPLKAMAASLKING